jgi:hypothetical protein
MQLSSWLDKRPGESRLALDGRKKDTRCIFWLRIRITVFSADYIHSDSCSPYAINNFSILPIRQQKTEEAMLGFNVPEFQVIKMVCEGVSLSHRHER